MHNLKTKQKNFLNFVLNRKIQANLPNNNKTS